MTAPTALGACRKCAKAAPLGASFCPSCGSPLGDIAVIQLEPIGGRRDQTPDDAARPRVTGWGSRALLVAGCGLLVATLLATRSPSERAAPATPTTQPSTTTQTTTPAAAAPTSTAPPTATTLAPFVGLPPIGGYLVALSGHGELVQIDLATGVPTSMALTDSGDFHRLHVLDDGVALQGDDRIALITPSGELRPLGSGWVIASTPTVLLVALNDASNRIELRDSSGTVVATPATENTDWLGVTPEGGLAVQRAQRIGVADAQDGGFSYLTDGVALYANGSALVRLTCETLTRCELRTGTFADPDRWRAAADALPRDAELTSSPSGRYLVAVDWNTQQRTLLDLADGGIRELDAFGPGAPALSAVSFSADERWLAFISGEGTEVELVSVDGEATHTLPLTDSQIVSVAFTARPVIADR